MYFFVPSPCSCCLWPGRSRWSPWPAGSWDWGQTGSGTAWGRSGTGRAGAAHRPGPRSYWTQTLPPITRAKQIKTITFNVHVKFNTEIVCIQHPNNYKIEVNFFSLKFFNVKKIPWYFGGSSQKPAYRWDSSYKNSVSCMHIYTFTHINLIL